MKRFILIMSVVVGTLAPMTAVSAAPSFIPAPACNTSTHSVRDVAEYGNTIGTMTMRVRWCWNGNRVTSVWSSQDVNAHISWSIPSFQATAGTTWLNLDPDGGLGPEFYSYAGHYRGGVEVWRRGHFRWCPIHFDWLPCVDSYPWLHFYLHYNGTATISRGVIT